MGRRGDGGSGDGESAGRVAEDGDDGDGLGDGGGSGGGDSGSRSCSPSQQRSEEETHKDNGRRGREGREEGGGRKRRGMGCVGKVREEEISSTSSQVQVSCAACKGLGAVCRPDRRSQIGRAHV